MMDACVVDSKAHTCAHTKIDKHETICAKYSDKAAVAQNSVHNIPTAAEHSDSRDRAQ